MYPDRLRRICFRCCRKDRSDAYIVCACYVGSDRSADDVPGWNDAPEGRDGNVVGANVDASCPAGEGDVRAVVDDDRNGDGRDQRAPEVDERSRVGVFEPELNDCGAASRRGACAGDEPVATVTQIVGDRDQCEIDRRASLCSENVSLNS